MPSPFPGMDPYIESPEIWTDFHSNLAPEIQGRLNGVIQPRYVARLNARVTYELLEISETRSGRPDLGVRRRRGTDPATGGPSGGTVVAPVESRVEHELPLRLLSVEVLKVDTLELVTAIEILSPVNKRPAHDAHKDYARKRRELLRSAAHLLEIDLLRGGERPPLEDAVPDAPYYVMLSRAERRPKVEVWPIQLRDRLPAIPVPLLEPDPDVTIDLAEAAHAVYERGGYAVLVDYRREPPPPPLTEDDARWMDGWLRAQGRR